MLKTGESIVLFTAFLSFKMNFQFESILQVLDLMGAIWKEKSNRTSLHNYISIKVND